jgi:glutathione S-transferase
LFTNNQYDDKNLTATANSLLVKLDFLLTGKTWSAGDRITISDFLVFETADFCKNYNQDQFSNYPNVVRIH